MSGWGFVGFGGLGGFPMPQRFEEPYHCYSVAAADKGHLEKGDKILLPPSAFDTLARLQVDYPMLFRLTAGDRTTHCGVLEFTAEEGCCYIPYWMMQNLLIEEGALITVTNVSLPKATFVKLQPQSVDFLEISNPRAVLEHALRNFSCVTVHDVIQIPYNNKNYHFELKEVTPSPAACIIETDCNVDFDAPVGYKEPTPPAAAANNSQRSSACPSPTATMSTASSLPGEEQSLADDDAKPAANSGTRIVNGQIIRANPQQQQAASGAVGSDLVAPKLGQTGIQKNAAIPEQAPPVNYWAINAGDGARLDGKMPAELKDATGQVVDIRRVRAEAAARRLQEQQAAAAAAFAAKEGMTLDGTKVAVETDTLVPAPGSGAPLTASPSSSSGSMGLVSKRKSRVGNKFSRLKQSGVAFQGSANSFH